MLGTYIRRYYGSRYYGKAMNQTRLLTAAYDAALSQYDLLTSWPPRPQRGRKSSGGEPSGRPDKSR